MSNAPTTPGAPAPALDTLALSCAAAAAAWAALAEFVGDAAAENTCLPMPERSARAVTYTLPNGLRVSVALPE